MAERKNKGKDKRGGLLGRLPTPKLPLIGGGDDDKQQSPPSSGPGSFGAGQQGGSRFGGGGNQPRGGSGQGRQQPAGRGGGGIGGRLGIGGSGSTKSGGGGSEGGLLGGRLGFGGRKDDKTSSGGRPSGPARGGSQAGGRPGGSGPGGQQQSRFGGGSQPGGQRPGGGGPAGARPGGGNQPGGQRPGGTGPGGQQQSRFGGGSQPGGQRPGGAGPAGTRPGGSGAAATQQGGSRFGSGSQPGGQRPGGAGPVGARPGGTGPGGQQQSRLGGGSPPGGSQPGGQRPGGARPGGSGLGGARPGGQGQAQGGQQQQSRLGASSKLPPPPGGKTQQQQPGKQRKRATTTAAKAKPRTTKKKKQDTLLSLDTKLDILGVALVVAAVILVLSFLSKEPGTLTGFVLTVVRQFLGWGGFLVPIPLGAAGVWLILRRFEDRLPDIDPLRLIGGGVAFVAALTGIHFLLLLFKPDCPAPPQFTQPAYRMAVCGHGGGYVGAFIYTSLHNLIGGGGVFVTFVAAALVGGMLAAELTAKEAVELGVRGYHYLRKGGPATAFVRTGSGTMKPVQAEGEADQDAKGKEKSATKTEDGKEPAKAASAKADEKQEMKPETKQGEDDKAKPGAPKLPGIADKAPVAATAAAAAATTASPATASAPTAGTAGASAPAAPRPAPSRPAPSRPGPGGSGPPAVAGGASPPSGGPGRTFSGPQGRELPVRDRPARPVPKSEPDGPGDSPDGDDTQEAQAGSPVPPPPRRVTPPPRPTASTQSPVAPPRPAPTPAPFKPDEAGDDGEKATADEADGSGGAGAQAPPTARPVPPVPGVERLASTPDDEADGDQSRAEAAQQVIVEAAAEAPSEIESSEPESELAASEKQESADGKGSEPFPDEYSPPTVMQGGQKWELPVYHGLLKPGVERALSDDELRRRAEIIENTLASFGAPGRVVEVNQGPVITQFGVEPDYIETRSGKRTKVKVGKISALADDIALALAAPTIRIEAPVPGKGYIGVEVPNPEPSLVSLREIMDSEHWTKIDSSLKIGLGMDVSGQAVAADLTAMPHLLIAGTTGSGKSVCVNGIISAMLLTRTPDELKMIMVDPKRVELTNYNGIPHLMAPVVTELERIVGVLKWVQREMDERYRRFAMAGARNIGDFNRRAEKNGEEKLYYIVVIVDELADLMMLAPEETERVITRLAQMARATGIHIIISTQRPSVDVVTGLIKANFPARIAFAVPTGVDSRVILDMPGAERLLGQGDMLFQAPDAAMPLRLQGTFVSDEEIDAIVEFWRKQGVSTPPPPPVPDGGKKSPAPAASSAAAPAAAVAAPATAVQRPLFEKVEEDDASSEDALFDETVSLARSMGKISISLLQRRLRIGYTRAARLIDLMEEQGIIGPHEGGSKPRKVLSADGKEVDDSDSDEDDKEEEEDEGDK